MRVGEMDPGVGAQEEGVGLLVHLEAFLTALLFLHAFAFVNVPGLK